MRPREHRLPFELVGMATLTVDYLSRWGEEVELLSVLLATLIIGLLLDAQGYFAHLAVVVLYGVIVVLEFVVVVMVALKRRELELELWRAVHEMESRVTESGTPARRR